MDPADGIGPRVARFRAERAIRVSELARAVGVSPSLISQIERGQSRPSVSTLFALAQALRVPVDAFFREEPPPRDADHRFTVVHEHDRAALDIEGGVRWERLTPENLRDIDFLELVYAPHAASHAALYTHPGTEMVLVLTGRLDIHVGFETYELGPGDSMHLPSSVPHRYVNPGEETTRAVTVIRHDG
jgi:transcriptional regulator with XRE-family HTH domain